MVFLLVFATHRWTCQHRRLVPVYRQRRSGGPFSVIFLSMKRTVLCLTLVFVASSAFAQMDMLPEVFRDLPPELRSGLPADMTFEHYRQMTRNVDFFTMFMSAWVPGYGFYQVEKPRLAAAIMAERLVAGGLMAAAAIRQWSDLRDISRIQDLSDEKFRSLMVNATLFGAGVVLNGMGWAIDVLGAYHIANVEKDQVLYRYGLITDVDATNEERLRTYLRRALVQDDDYLEVEKDLERYLRAFPEGPAAPEMAFHLGTMKAVSGHAVEAFAYLVRSIYAYPDHDHTRAAERALVTLVHRHRDRWNADWDRLWSIASSSAAERNAERQPYSNFLRRLHEFQSTEFSDLFITEATYYLRRFPGSRNEAELLFLLGERAAAAGRHPLAVSSLASVIYVYRSSEYFYRAVRALGSLYEVELSEPDRAAEIYEIAAEAPAKDLGKSEELARKDVLDRLAALHNSE